MDRGWTKERPARRWGLLAALAAAAGLTWARRDQHRQLYPPRGEVWALPSGPTHVIEGGRADGPPLLLIHGSDGVALDWPLSPLWDRLAPYARLTAPDRPGHGYTPARPGEAVTVEKNVERCLELLGALGLERVTVVGHSYGAAVALALALREPARVRALVLISPLVLPAKGLTRPLAYVPRVPVLEPLLTRVLLLPAGRIVAHIEGSNAFYPAPVPPAWRRMMAATSASVGGAGTGRPRSSADSSANNHGRPRQPRPTTTPSQPVSSIMRRASPAAKMSPLPSTGTLACPESTMCSFSRAICDQSACPE